MRRQVRIYQPADSSVHAGLYQQKYTPAGLAMLSMQPVGDGKTFAAYLTGRKVDDYMIAIGEVALTATEEGKSNGSLVLCDGQHYEVVARKIWKNGVINHFTYLLYSMTDRETKSRMGV
ncbi:hypothetical protein I9753_001470 [Serratia marcescens]|uniref:hypothetical protein n=1 Tax=Serratia marcescens TaxID=615 RepID=UPI00274C39AF|nr:hypothetical protein [Serratia marcescens]MDP8630525.1 hypothetical protein [Serratia marcescens]MDP8749357.1 hypothetical protein [Serratia marcescens]